MSNREELLTPIGRLVQGSLYEPQTTNAENKPLVYKSGPNAGQPRVEFYFALAIPKGNETHWNQTPWGQKIHRVAHAGFPNGQPNSPSFAWKVKNGDSTEANRAGRRPCDCEGFPGHWILSFTSGFAPSIYNEDGSQQLTETNRVNLGDYIQVAGTVADNESLQQPGVYLNHSMVAFAGYGKRIILGPDPKTVGFGNCPLPAGASKTPISQGFNPVQPIEHAQVSQPAAAPTVVQPYPEILTPPAPVAAPAHIMLPAANGATYEQMIAAGWTDAQLIQYNMMKA